MTKHHITNDDIMPSAQRTTSFAQFPRVMTHPERDKATADERVISPCSIEWTGDGSGFVALHLGALARHLF